LHINYTSSDATTDIICWYSNDTYAVNTTLASCINITGLTWTIGEHNVTIWANDSANNLNSSFVNFSISTDTNNPNLTINAPTNTTYTSTNIVFNATMVDDSSVTDGGCWVSIDAGVTNLTLQNTTTFNDYTATNTTVPDGGYRAQFWCNDSLDNVNNAEDINFSVAVSTTPTPTAAPSAGGGGGMSISLQDNFKIDPENMNIRVVLGETNKRDFRVTNLLDQNIKVNIRLEELGDFVILDEDSVELEPNQGKNVGFKIVSPNEAGIYTGKIVLSYLGTTKDFLITINTQSKDTLFDISVNVADDSLEIGEELKAQLNLIPVGQKGVDVTVKYLIKDFRGKVYYENSETFYVDSEITKTKEIDLSEYNLFDGDYILGTEMTYLGGFATASSQFKIMSEKKIYLAIYLISGIVVFGIIMTIILGISRKKRMKKYKSQKSLG